MTELQGQAPATEVLEQSAREAPLGWRELPAFSTAGTEEAAAKVLEVVEQVMLEVVDGSDGPGSDWDVWGVFNGATTNEQSAIVRYVLERRPAAEVLFNKLTEWGFHPPEGPAFGNLLPVHRAGIEVAVRVIPAVADTIEALNTLIVAKNPPPTPTISTVPVDPEDTILEPIDGPDDIDAERAAIQAASADAAGERERKASKGKSKPKKARSIDAED